MAMYARREKLLKRFPVGEEAANMEVPESAEQETTKENSQ